MARRFVDTANAFVFYPSLKKAKFALVRYVRGSVARPAVGIFIVQLNCHCTSMLLPSKG